MSGDTNFVFFHEDGPIVVAQNLMVSEYMEFRELERACRALEDGAVMASLVRLTEMRHRLVAEESS